jgi:tetratricopeptide (TPR) repeat protein
VYAWSGRIDEGIALLEEAVTAYESAGVGYCHSISVAQLGETYLLAQRVEDAGACADRAVTLARGRGERGYEAWALRLLGEVTSHQSRLDVATAEAHYGAALGLASELRMRPLMAHCHRGLATLYARVAERKRAEEHLAKATAMYREMDMGFWLELADAAPGPRHGKPS